MSNNTEQIFMMSQNLEQYAKGYFKYLYELLLGLDTMAIAAFACELETAYKGQNTIFIAGNGGSAGTASHMANDLGIDLRSAFEAKMAKTAKKYPVAKVRGKHKKQL